jgi:transposase
MSRKRKQTSAKFKAQVVVASVSGERTQAGLAAKFEVHPMLITIWRNKLEEHAGELVGKWCGRAEMVMDMEVAELCRQVGKLKVERDFLAQVPGPSPSS